MRDPSDSAICDAAAITFRPASFTRRLIATSIDGVAWLVLSFGGFLACTYLAFHLELKQSWVSLAFQLNTLVMPFYFLTEAFGYRRTGKRIAGLMIADQDGSPPTRRGRLFRWAIKSSPWLLTLPLASLAKHFPETPFFNTLLDGYPNLVGGFIVRLPERMLIACGADFGMRELLLDAPDYAMSFVAEGMFLLTILVVGEVLILFPARRSLVDQLSGTMVVRKTRRARRGFEALPACQPKSTLVACDRSADRRPPQALYASGCANAGEQRHAAPHG